MTFLDFSSHDSTQLITLGTQSARLTDANRSILSSYSSYLWMIDDNLLALPVMAISIRALTLNLIFVLLSTFYTHPANLFIISLSEMDILAMEIINFNLKWWWKVRRDFDDAFEWEILNISFFFLELKTIFDIWYVFFNY